jgi:rod shape-determining protein MreD
MKRTAFRLFFLFILLVFLQIWLFNNIHLLGFATPLLYIYFVIKLPVSMNRNTVLALSVLLGLTIDAFNCTLGLNMLAMVIIGFTRYYFLKLFIPRDIFDDFMPSFSSLEKPLFLRYAGTLTLSHALILYTVESLTLFDPVTLLLRIVGSFLLTLLFIFAFESVNFKVFKK